MEIKILVQKYCRQFCVNVQLLDIVICPILAVSNLHFTFENIKVALAIILATESESHSMTGLTCNGMNCNNLQSAGKQYHPQTEANVHEQSSKLAEPRSGGLINHDNPKLYHCISLRSCRHRQPTDLERLSYMVNESWGNSILSRPPCPRYVTRDVTEYFIML